MKIYIYLLGILLLLTSCDDFLTIVPTGKVIPTTLAENRALLLDAYTAFPSDRGLATFRSDEVLMNTSSSIDVANYGDIYLWQDYSSGVTTSSFNWLSYYEVIFICNQIINTKEDITAGTVEEINQLAGEAHMMRAYTYFTLMNLYSSPANTSSDDTPTIPLNLNNDMQATLPRAPMSETLNQISSDTQNGLQLMTTQSQSTDEIYWWSLEAAKAFKIRQHLYLEEWDSVIVESTSLMANTDRSLADMVSDANVVPNSYNSPETFIGIEVALNSDYILAIYVSDTLLNKYNRNDKRLTRYYKAETKKIYTVRKGGSTSYRCSFRLGEVYLSLAEAYAEKGQYSAARDTLFALVEKRVSSNYFTTYQNYINNIDDHQLLNEIYEERCREFAFEGQRWFDLRRTTQAQITHTLNGTEYTLEQGDTRYTIPIPEGARNANPLLNN